MPAVKVFVSSTCYDLTTVRDSLRRFIFSLGHEPVMSDYADVLYDPRVHTQSSCVEEVKNCDILILIIGGRFGGKAIGEAVDIIDFEKIFEQIKEDKFLNDRSFSITFLEFFKAIERGIPVYTFIKENVLNDHKVYEKNKSKPIINEITFPSIEKRETAKYIFEFINVVRLRNPGNNIFSFKNEADIEEILKKQWSSYFKKLLKEQSVSEEKENIHVLKKSVDDLRELVWEFINETPREMSLQAGQKNKHRRILWVDDYPENNESVIKFFEGQDIHVDIAQTTEKGLKLFKTELYDIIITDMGRGNNSNAGILLIKELNRLHCQVPIIVYCSLQAIRKYGEQAKILGAYKVINGIVNITSLIADIYGLKNDTSIQA